MKTTHCITDAKYIRHFLDSCDSNWHRCIYVRCRTCSLPYRCTEPGFLFHPDENGTPVILPIQDANMIFSTRPDPEECIGTMTLSDFLSLYQLYLKKEELLNFPCPIRVLIKKQTENFYDW